MRVKGINSPHIYLKFLKRKSLQDFFLSTMTGHKTCTDTGNKDSETSTINDPDRNNWTISDLTVINTFWNIFEGLHCQEFQ